MPDDATRSVADDARTSTLLTSGKRMHGGPKVGKVLVLGQDERAFLSIIRSLGRSGLEVHVSWCPPSAIARRSRYIAQAHELAAPAVDPDQWREPLLALLREEHFDLVIPVPDPAIIPLQVQRQAIERLTRLALPSDEALAIGMSKLRTWQLARASGVPVPEGAVARATTDAEALASRFGLPLILKPDTSFTGGQLRDRRMVRTLRTVDELREALRSLGRGEEVLVQARMPGRGAGVEFLAFDGEILFAFQHLRVHEPLTGGGSSYRVSTPLHPDLLAATRTLVAALRYTGVGMAEFKLDGKGEKGSRWSLMEINPRFWGSLPLALAAGANFPLYLYELLVEGRRVFPAAYREGVYSRNWAADLSWLIANVRADHKDPSLMTLPLGRVAGEIGHVVSGREHSDTLAFDDPAPGLAELGHMARTIGMKIASRFGRAKRAG